MADNNLSKDDFIRLLADMACFTIKDTRIFWQAVEEIFQDLIMERVALDIRGFGHLYFQTIPARRGFDPLTRAEVDYPETIRVIFRLSQNLRDIHRSPEKKRRTYFRRGKRNRPKPNIIHPNE